MIDIYVKMKTNKYDHIIEELFTNYSSLKKDTVEHYYTNGNDLGNVYGRCKDLMMQKWFRDNVNKLSWVVGDEGESDLVNHFTKTLTRDGFIS